VNPRPALSDGLILVLGLAVLLNYVDRANLATAAPLLQDELSLSSAQIGVLLSSFFWVYAPAQLLAGWLVDRFDIRIVLAAGLALWGVATATTGLAVGFASILVLRLILGLGESVLFPGYQLILSRHTAEHERGRANGFIGAGQGAGPMVGTLFGGLAMARFGWRAMFVGLGVVTLLWLWPWLVTTRGRSFESPAEHVSVSIPYPAILRRREFWGAALGHFSINYAFYFVITWLPTFLIKAGGFTVSQMAGIGAAIYGVYAVATALAGVLSDRWIRKGASTTLVRALCAGECHRRRGDDRGQCPGRAALRGLAARGGRRVLRIVDTDHVRDDRNAGRSARGRSLGRRAERVRPARRNHRADRDRPDRRSHRCLFLGVRGRRGVGDPRGRGLGHRNHAGRNRGVAGRTDARLPGVTDLPPYARRVATWRISALRG
jgi:MFS family permease